MKFSHIRTTINQWGAKKFDLACSEMLCVVLNRKGERGRERHITFVTMAKDQWAQMVSRAKAFILYNGSGFVSSSILE